MTTGSSRIDDLRRRVQADPTSIAFAQLAEELRRAGQLQEAVAICRSGLVVHPSYLSARITLGRALLDLDQLEEAQRELTAVVQITPENFPALRALGECHLRRGQHSEALLYFTRALGLAPNDPDLEATVTALARKAAPVRPPAPDAGNRERRTIVALEQWLEAIHVARANRRA